MSVCNHIRVTENKKGDFFLTVKITLGELIKLGFSIDKTSVARGSVSTSTLSATTPPKGGVVAAISYKKEIKSHSKQQKSSRWKLYATLLHKAILKVRNMTKLNTRNWAYQFQTIHFNDSVPIPRLREVLKWYCSRLVKSGDLIRSNPDMIPIAYNAQSFRKKFDRIEGSMVRWNMKHGFEESVEPKKKFKKEYTKKSKKQNKWEKWGL